MAFWMTLALWVGTTIVGELLRPKPKIENARAATLADFDIPTATEARPVPVVWGTRQIKGANVIWYGGFRASPITKKVKTGLFSKKKVTTGYRYSIAMHMALCHGPVDAIIEVQVGGKAVWTGTANAGTQAISQPDLFGGDQQGGGLDGTLEFLPGDSAQAQHGYLAAHLGDVPAYRGFQCVLWDGYIGTSTSVRPFAFTVRRLPAALGTGYEDIGGSANPAEAIYEILTDATWGMGASPGTVDLDSFRTAATTLGQEGHGLDLLWTGRNRIGDILRTILDQIDGVLYVDHQSGKWTLRLARGGYDPATLPILDESAIVKLSAYSRGAWDETTNEVKIRYTDREDGHRERYAVAQDLANVEGQAAVVGMEMTFPGIGTAALAAQVAARELKAVSYPLARISLVCNRQAAGLRPGDLFRWSWAELGIADMAMRVTKVGYGELHNGAVAVEATQDVFAVSDAIFAPPQPSGWLDPISDPLPVAVQRLIEAPLWFTARELSGTSTDDLSVLGTQGAMLYLGHRPSDDAIDHIFEVQDPVSGAWEEDGQGTFSDFSQTTGSIGKVDTTIAFAAGTLRDTQPGAIALLENEWLIIDAIDSAAGTMTVRRGCLDSVPATHPVGADIWIVDPGGTLGSEVYPQGAVLSARARTVTLRGELDSASATIAGPLTLDARAWRPYPPGRLRIGGTAYPVRMAVTEIQVTWAHRDRTVLDTIYDESAPDVGPEAGVSYGVRIYGGTDQASMSLVQTYSWSYLDSLTLVNPDAETGDLTGWVVDQGAPSVRSVDPTPQQGVYYFYGGDSSAYSLLHQDVSATTATVSAADIDAGDISAKLRWLQASWGGADQARVYLEFYDASMTLLGDTTADIPLEATTPSKTWEERVYIFPLPAGTRTIRVVQEMNRVSGTNNDGYVDLIQLDLGSGLGGSSLPQFTYRHEDELADGGPFTWLGVEVFSLRDGIESQQAPRADFERAGYGYNYGNYYGG